MKPLEILKEQNRIALVKVNGLFHVIEIDRMLWQVYSVLFSDSPSDGGRWYSTLTPSGVQYVSKGKPYKAALSSYYREVKNKRRKTMFDYNSVKGKLPKVEFSYTTRKDSIFNDNLPRRSFLVRVYSFSEKKYEEFEYTASAIDYYKPYPIHAYTSKPKFEGKTANREKTLVDASYKDGEKEQVTLEYTCSFLSSLLLDADCGRGYFSDFCSDFGYDDDSRKAYKTYEACRETAEKLDSLFSAKEIKELQELLQDY